MAYVGSRTNVWQRLASASGRQENLGYDEIYMRVRNYQQQVETWITKIPVAPASSRLRRELNDFHYMLEVKSIAIQTDALVHNNSGFNYVPGHENVPGHFEYVPNHDKDGIARANDINCKVTAVFKHYESATGDLIGRLIRRFSTVDTV
jgi:hypothetical protein